MYKTYIKIFLLLTLSFSTPGLARAQYVVFDPTQYATQIPQFAKEIITSVAAVATEVSTYIIRYKETVLDPLANAMMIVTLLQQQNATANLVTGALGGTTLLKDNPEQWIKNQGLNLVKISINDLGAQNGAYSGSILSSVIDGYRTASSLKGQLESLGNSSIPSMVQTNVCREASLLAIAKNDVMQSDGTYDETALKNRKQDLFNSLCVGNPTINITLGKRLTEVNKQRPDIGGPETFLAVAFGDNEYNRSVQAKLAIANDVALKEKAAERDIVSGGGVVSPTRCADTPEEEALSDSINIASVLCRNTVITGLGSAINSAWQQTLNAPVQKLISADGSNVLGSIGTLFSAWNTVSKLQNSFSSALGESGGGGEGSSNTSDGQASLSSVVTPVVNQLESTLETLSSLETTHQGLLAQTEVQKNDAEQVRACFQTLVRELIITEQSQSYSRMNSYYIGKINEADVTKVSILREKDDIAALRSLVNETLTNVSAATTADGVNTAYNTYNQKILTQKAINNSAVALRQGEIATYRGNIQVDRSIGGDGYTLKTECADIRTEYERITTGGA